MDVGPDLRSARPRRGGAPPHGRAGGVARTGVDLLGDLPAGASGVRKTQPRGFFRKLASGWRKARRSRRIVAGTGHREPRSVGTRSRPLFRIHKSERTQMARQKMGGVGAPLGPNRVAATRRHPVGTGRRQPRTMVDRNHPDRRPTLEHASLSGNLGPAPCAGTARCGTIGVRMGEDASHCARFIRHYSR